jgi:hypothetical protein
MWCLSATYQLQINLLPFVKYLGFMVRSYSFSKGNDGDANDIMLSIAAKAFYGGCMPRQVRIDTIGALHHVIIRGIERGKDLSI